jgi:hypothetical protein
VFSEDLNEILCTIGIDAHTHARSTFDMEDTYQKTLRFLDSLVKAEYHRLSYSKKGERAHDLCGAYEKSNRHKAIFNWTGLFILGGSGPFVAER